MSSKKPTDKNKASQQLKEARRQGLTVKLWETDEHVLYAPRRKFDPEPWLEPVSQTYYSGTACYADLS